MAAAIAALTESKRFVLEGGHHMVIGRLSLTLDYATGGISYTGVLKSTKLIYAKIGPSGGYIFEPNHSTKKIVIKAPISVAGGAAAAGTEVLSLKSNVVNHQAVGTPQRDLNTLHSAAKEIPNATTLSGLTSVPFFAVFSGSP